MLCNRIAIFATLLCAFACGVTRAADEPLPDRVVFNRDIRPILSDTCLKCHGFDEKERKAGLRLDTREGLIHKHKDITPIVPGNLSASEVYRRITTADEDEYRADEDDIARIGVAPMEKSVFSKCVPGLNLSAIIPSGTGRASLIL